MLFLLSLGVFVLCFAVAERMKATGSRQSTQKVPAQIAGVAVWGMFIALLYGLVRLAVFVHYLVTAPPLESGGDWVTAVFLFIGAALGIAILYRMSQALDMFAFYDFFVKSIFFRGCEVRKKDIFVEVEKEAIAAIHRESSDAPLPQYRQFKEIAKTKDPEALKRELAELKAKPVQSIHLSEELQRLRSGEMAEITESWHLNSFRKPPHAWYANVTHARLDPAQGELLLDMGFPDVHRDQFRDKRFTRRFQQSIFELLQALNAEEWMGPYRPFFGSITLTCYRTREEDFGSLQQHPFMKITISRAELERRSGRMINAAKLGEIAILRFSDGDFIGE